MKSKSQAVVDFIGNLWPLYAQEQLDDMWCARSLVDGTLILPDDESDWDEERGRVRVRWQGDPGREAQTEGEHLATLALERYVRLHGVGYSEEVIAAELHYMANHFTFKTGCHVCLHQLPEPPTRIARVGRRAAEMGQGVLVNFISKFL